MLKISEHNCLSFCLILEKKRLPELPYLISSILTIGFVLLMINYKISMVFRYRANFSSDTVDICN